MYIQNRLLQLLKTEGVLMADTISDTLKVDEETVYQTVSDLRQVHFPIRWHERRVFLAKQFFLSKDDVVAELQPHNRRQISVLDIEDVTDSTNGQLSKRELNDQWQVLVAEHQQAGRGRRGRSWFGLFGYGLYFSLGKKLAAHELNVLPLRVGLSLAMTLRALGFGEVGLKWPNDLVATEKKLAGILVESQSQSGDCQVVIGIGLNLKSQAPVSETLDYQMVGLEDLSDVTIPHRSLLLGRFLDDLIGNLSTGLQTSELVEQWRDLDAYLGREVIVKTAQGEINGIASGIDESGALIVQLGSTYRSFVAGEVSLRLRK